MATEQELYEQFMYEQFLQSQQPAIANEDIPTGSDLAGTPMPAATEKEGYGIKDTFLGMLETAAALTTGSTAGAFGQVVGTVDGFVNSLLDGKEFGTGEVAEATADRAAQLSDHLIYAPRTEAGQDFTQAVGGAMAPLEALEPIMPALPDVGRMPGALRDDMMIADNGGVHPDAPPMNPDGTPMGRKASVDRSAALLRDGGGMPEGQVNMIRNASPETRRTMALMMNDAKYVEANPNMLNRNNPRNRIADDIQSRMEGFAVLHKQYGADVKKAVDENKGVQVDVGALTQQIGAVLDEAGIGLGNKDKADLTGGRVNYEAQGKANDILGRLFKDLEAPDGTVNFEVLHNLKGWMQDNADFSPRPDGSGGSNTMNAAIKQISGLINETLREAGTDSYRQANANFSATSEFYQGVNQIVGQRNDISDPAALNRIALRTRGITNNTQAGNDLRISVDGMSQMLIDNWKDLPPEVQRNLNVQPQGGTLSFANDLETLATFAASIEHLYPNMRPTSFQSLSNLQNFDSANHTANATFNFMYGNKIGGTIATIKGLNKLVPQSMKDASNQKAGARQLEDRNRQRDRMSDALLELLRQ